jgi:hypothetical protein
MPFRQTYYTSCQQGLRGGKGFQINAATEGIEPSVLQQIERLGLYVPPVSVPSRPTLEEIARFPVSLLFQRLGDGSAVLAQAKYTGADYSGRFGNYFTHSLVCTDPVNDLGKEGLLPVELWGALTWNTSESQTVALPPLSQLEAGGVIDPERVAEFLSEGARLERLPAFLTAVMGALSTGRRIIIVDESHAVALWIAAASYALPRLLALKLTFNTYVKNPYQTEFLIVGTTSDSDFGFASHEIEHQFYVFDFEGGRFTPLNETSAFARLASAVYTPELVHIVAGFDAFIERVAPETGLEELDVAFSCHAKLAGVELPDVDDVRVMGWCARHINRFEVAELRSLLTSITEEGAARAEVVDAYTDLYLAALSDSTRQDIRRLIELPYLEWLIRKACGVSSLAVLEHAAQRLRVEQSIKQEASPLMLSWVKLLRQSGDARRLPVLFAIADKLGFFDSRDDSLQLVGEETVGASLADASARRILEQYINRPGMQSVLYGVGTYLAGQVGSPKVFRPLADLLDHDEVYKTLVGYAFDHQALSLYFRLVGAKIPDAPTHPDQRIIAFTDCIKGIRRISPSLPVELVENAYDAVWQNSLPAFDEAITLLDLLDHLKLNGTHIPERLVALIAACDVLAPEPKQQELLKRLSPTNALYGTLGERHKLIIDAYRIPSGLELSGEQLPHVLQESFGFLERHTELDERFTTRLYLAATKYLVQVKDVELHAKLLVRAYRHGGGPIILDAYEQAILASLEKQSNTRPKVLARLVQVWTVAEQRGAKAVASNLFDETLPAIISKWRTKELENVEAELAGNPPALGRWLLSREEAKGKGVSGVKGFFGKLMGSGRERR